MFLAALRALISLTLAWPASVKGDSHTLSLEQRSSTSCDQPEINNISEKEKREATKFRGVMITKL
jgi:hypothetical protein